MAFPFGLPPALREDEVPGGDGRSSRGRDGTGALPAEGRARIRTPVIFTGPQAGFGARFAGTSCPWPTGDDGANRESRHARVCCSGVALRGRVSATFRTARAMPG